MRSDRDAFDTRSLLSNASAVSSGGGSGGGGGGETSVGVDDLHEQALLSTAILSDFRIVRSIAAGNNGQIFEVACKIPQVRAFVFRLLCAS